MSKSQNAPVTDQNKLDRSVMSKTWLIYQVCPGLWLVHFDFLTWLIYQVCPGLWLVHFDFLRWLIYQVCSGLLLKVKMHQ
jgi:hypothetical protein